MKFLLSILFILSSHQVLASDSAEVCYQSTIEAVSAELSTAVNQLKNKYNQNVSEKFDSCEFYNKGEWDRLYGWFHQMVFTFSSSNGATCSVEFLKSTEEWQELYTSWQAIGFNCDDGTSGVL